MRKIEINVMSRSCINGKEYAILERDKMLVLAIFPSFLNPSISGWFNSLSNNKIPYWSKLKAFADYKIEMVK